MIYIIKHNIITNKIKVEENDTIGGEIDLTQINAKTDKVFVAITKPACDAIVKGIKKDVIIQEIAKNQYLKKKNTTIKDLDRAREEYGDAYDEYPKTMDTNYFGIKISNTFKDFD